jgi:hypothetical protein
MGMQLIETIELASAAASIEFLAIPQDGVDLLVLVSARSTTSAQTYVYWDTNGSSGIDSRVVLMSDSGGISSTTDYRAWVPGSNATANTFSNTSIYYSNYTSSVAKSVAIDSVSENMSGSVYGESLVAVRDDKTGSAASPDAVTSLELFLASGNLAQYSTASLYKITAD